jgi:hypothetical protein
MVSTSGNQKGGGYGSRQHVEKPVGTGSGSHSTRPAGVGQIGAMQGDHVTHVKGSTGYKGERLHNPERNTQFTPFGNEIAARTVCGPGGSREVLRSGGQGRHGSPAGSRPAPGRGILDNS